MVAMFNVVHEFIFSENFVCEIKSKSLFYYLKEDEKIKFKCVKMKISK